MDPKTDTQQNSRDRNARMALGICIGLALGIAEGVALDSIPIGIAMGLGVGTALGIAFSGRGQKPSRALTVTAVALLLVGIVVLAVVMHLVAPNWWCGYPILNLWPGC